jgi:hypothetical protein
MDEERTLAVSNRATTCKILWLVDAVSDSPVQYPSILQFTGICKQKVILN